MPTMIQSLARVLRYSRDEPLPKEDQDAWLRHIAENPADLTRSQIFADWLDDHDRPAMANHLRLSQDVRIYDPYHGQPEETEPDGKPFRWPHGSPDSWRWAFARPGHIYRHPSSFQPDAGDDRGRHNSPGGEATFYLPVPESDGKLLAWTYSNPEESDLDAHTKSLHDEGWPLGNSLASIAVKYPATKRRLSRLRRVLRYDKGMKKVGPRVVGVDPGSATTGQDWYAKYPSFAEGDQEQLQSPDRQHDIPPATVGGWESAPSTSHVDSFRLDAGKLEKKYVGWKKGGSAAGRAVLSVRFKPSGHRGTTLYRYFFDRDEDAIAAYDLLKESRHPGKVVHGILIGGGVPYKRIYSRGLNPPRAVLIYGPGF